MILEEEVTFYQAHTDVPAVHQLLQDVVDIYTQLKRNEFLVVIGWGGGWHTKRSTNC